MFNNCYILPEKICSGINVLPAAIVFDYEVLDKNAAYPCDCSFTTNEGHVIHMNASKPSTACDRYFGVIKELLRPGLQCHMLDQLFQLNIVLGNWEPFERYLEVSTNYSSGQRPFFKFNIEGKYICLNYVYMWTWMYVCGIYVCTYVWIMHYACIRCMHASVVARRSVHHTIW